LGRQNLLRTDNWEAETLGEWTAGAGADLSLVWDPLSIHGRYALHIEDNSAVNAEYAECLADAGETLDRTFFIGLHARRISGEGTGAMIRVVHPSGSPALTSTFTVTGDQRAYFWWVVTIDDSGGWTETASLRLRVFPVVSTNFSGIIEVMAPRIHRVFTELTNWPRDPPALLGFSPRVIAQGGGQAVGFGSAPTIEDGMHVDVDASYPFHDNLHAADLGSLVGHRGYVFFEPDSGSHVGILAERAPEPWAPEYPHGHMAGYANSHLAFRSVDPYYCPPTARSYRETSDGIDTGHQVWRRGG
jgi:hypothetical protein